MVVSKNVNKGRSDCNYAVIWVWSRCNHTHIFKDTDMIIYPKCSGVKFLIAMQKNFVSKVIKLWKTKPIQDCYGVSLSPPNWTANLTRGIRPWAP